MTIYGFVKDFKLACTEIYGRVFTDSNNAVKLGKY